MTSLVELEDLDEYLYQDETTFLELYAPQQVVFLLPGELHKPQTTRGGEALAVGKLMGSPTAFAFIRKTNPSFDFQPPGPAVRLF